MAMGRARLLAALAGILLPYVARVPGGIDWLMQYLDTGIGGYLLLGAFNAVAWGAILLIGLGYRHPASLLAPALPGFAFLAWAHGTLDLDADAQAPVALIFIPLHALILIVPGGLAGYVLDMFLRRRQHGRAPGEAR